MNHRLSLVVLVGLVAVAASLAGCTDTTSAPQANTSQAKTYLVGIDVPYPPFSLIDDKGTPTGFDVESMQWIANDQGFKVEFQQVAWDSIIPTLEAGKIDIIYSGMTITDERKEKVNFSAPYWVVNQDVVARNASNITLEDVLAGKAVIGTQRGCTAAMWIEENLVNTSKMPAGNLKTYDNTPLAVNDLEAGRIDAVMYDDLVLKDIIEGKAIKRIGFVETKEEFGIAVRKADAELLAKINTGLARLKADPAWTALIAKYEMR
ncbi:MAG: basic amino acid ABC transporter substrate-binding protein [Methanobacteriota archaeon]|nr:MAG: basic amino acid ABC transporter substrate-binding protein [Euryarchaeota archaeon]